MDTLNKIPDTGAWNEIAAKTNDNFTKIATELHTLGTTTSVKLPLFASVSEAQSYIPSPYTGQLILIGTQIPAPVYRWNGSSWVDTGGIGGDSTSPLTNYYTKSEIDEMIPDVMPQQVLASQDEYDSLPIKDENTIYFILEEQ